MPVNNPLLPPSVAVMASVAALCGRVATTADRNGLVANTTIDGLVFTFGWSAVEVGVGSYEGDQLAQAALRAVLPWGVFPLGVPGAGSCSRAPGTKGVKIDQQPSTHARAGSVKCEPVHSGFLQHPAN